jgi:hypothetical protein
MHFIFLLLFLFSSSANAVDLRPYFPETVTYLSKANGTPQSKYSFISNNQDLKNLYTSYLNLNKAGAPFYWKKDYWINNAWCTATYAIMFKGDDKTITEAGDWLASTPCTPNIILGYKSNGTSTGLIWANDTFDVTASLAEMNVWQQNAPSSAYEYSNYQAFHKTGVVEVLSKFKPKYGRLNGVWAEGNGTEYSDVIHIVMYHGTRKASGQVPIRCSAPIKADGAYYQSYKDYNSYAIELWLAKDVGIIQERTTFIEDGAYWSKPNCTGYVFNTLMEWYKDN